MPKVICAAIDCEFNVDGKCHAKTICLSANSVMTMWEGRQEFNKCKTFQKSQQAKQIEEQIKPFLEMLRAYHEQP